MDKLADRTYIKQNATKQWLLSHGFRYNSRLSDDESEVYTYRFPVYKYEKFTTLEGELGIILGGDEVKINVYDYGTSDRYAPFYYYEYGNCDAILRIIWKKINKQLGNLGIKKKTQRQQREVKIKRLKEDAIIPTRGSEQAAGYDLYACCDSVVTIEPHKTAKIGTGLSIQPPKGYFGAIFVRSGLATKQGLRPTNAVGICGQDYLGEYIVALHNDSDITKMIYPKDRIAQLIFLPYQDVEFYVVEELSSTERGTKGFGSTGA